MREGVKRDWKELAEEERKRIEKGMRRRWCELKDCFKQINLNLKEEAGLIYGQVFPSIDGSR